MINNYDIFLYILSNINKILTKYIYNIHSSILYKKYIMKFTDIIKLKTVIFMFKASTNSLTNNIQKLFISGRKHTFIRKQN